VLRSCYRTGLLDIRASFVAGACMGLCYNGAG